MGGEIVEDDDIARPQPRCENLLDIGAEPTAIHRPIEDHRQGHPGQL